MSKTVEVRLAEAVMRWSNMGMHGEDLDENDKPIQSEYASDFEFMAEVVVPLAEKVLVKARRKRRHFCAGCFWRPHSKKAKFCREGIRWVDKKPHSRCLYRKYGDPRKGGKWWER